MKFDLLCACGLAALSVLFLTAGCGGDDGSSPNNDTPSSADVTGDWTVTVVIVHVPELTFPDSEQWHLTQNGTAVTGTFQEEHDHYGDMVEGKIEGNVLSFKKRYLCHNGNPHGFDPALYVRCTVSGNTMSGFYRPVDAPEGVNQIHLEVQRL